MRTRVFRIDAYVQRNEYFHFARKSLSPLPPTVQHSHDFHELFIVEQGSATHRINDHVETLQRGDLLFIRPTDTHCLQADAAHGCHILNVLFRNEIAEHLYQRYPQELSARFFWHNEVVPPKIQLQGAQLERAINNTMELQNSIRSLTRVEQFLLSLLTHILDPSSTADSRMPKWLLNACEAAQSPDVFRRGAAGFVAEAGRGHEHVCRQMRKFVGLSPTEYVNKMRIQHAAMLLADSHLPLAKIAEQCGIENLSYFHKRFRQHYGTTPSRFRQRRRANPMQPH